MPLGDMDLGSPSDTMNAMRKAVIRTYYCILPDCVKDNRRLTSQAHVNRYNCTVSWLR